MRQLQVVREAVAEEDPRVRDVVADRAGCDRRATTDGEEDLVGRRGRRWGVDRGDVERERERGERERGEGDFGRGEGSGGGVAVRADGGRDAEVKSSIRDGQGQLEFS